MRVVARYFTIVLLFLAATAMSAQEFTVKLLSPVSTDTSKAGDKITAQVINPQEFQGDSMEGVVRRSNKDI